MAVTQKHENLSFDFEPKEEYLDKDFCKKVAKLREDGLSWDEIAEKVDISKSRAPLCAAVHEFGLLEFRGEKSLANAIVKARDDEGQSWGVISARTGGVSEGRVRALYELSAEKPYHQSDIGKGGRPREEDDGKTKPKKKTKKAKAKKQDEAPAEETTENDVPTFSDFDDDTDPDTVVAEVSEAITGKTITVARPAGKTATFEIEAVEAAKQNKTGAWGVKVKTADGKGRAFAISKIQEIA